jgi:hypothetical protein
MTRDNATSRTLASAGCLGGVSTSAISVTRAAGAGRQPAPAWSLAAALFGFFVVTLDAVIVNVALPDIRRELAGGMSGLQWVVDGYTLMFAALLLSAGPWRTGPVRGGRSDPAWPCSSWRRPGAASRRGWARWWRRGSCRARPRR